MSRRSNSRPRRFRAVPSWRDRVDMEVLARALLLLALDLSGHDDENETGNKAGGKLGEACPSGGRPGGRDLVADGAEEGGAS